MNREAQAYPADQQAWKNSIATALDALQNNRPLRAEEICREFLDRNPGSVDHLRLLGNALSRQSRLEEAERTIRLALSLKPDFPHLHEDLGSVLALQRRFEEAVPCFRRAIELEPRLALAHKKLGEALAELNRGQEADEAFEEFFELDPSKGNVALALVDLRAGRKPEAVDKLRRILRETPDNVDAMRVLAGIYFRDREQLGDAEALLRRATMLAPDFVAAWMLLGTLLVETNRHPEALEPFTRVTVLDPGHAAAWSGLGNVQSHMGHADEAARCYRRAIELSPEVPATYMSLGHALKTLGDQSGALEAYRAAIARKPEFGEVYWSMANLKVFRFDDAEVAAMERQLERTDLDEGTDVHFRFALGKAYEDKGDFDTAWSYYDTGNQRQRKRVAHDPVQFEVRHEEIREVFSAEFLAKHAGAGYEAPDPIFIVGLPRSGSTLIEQILASHSQVEGTAELPALGRIATSVGRYRPDNRQYPLSVRDLRSKDFRGYGKQYIDETRAQRSTGRPFFTDKLPNNFSHIGFAHQILPNAKVINARRHPFDSCLGAYKQLFGAGQDFTYDMTELALYYRQYHEIMQHWHAVLPGKVLDVHYEETVTDFETQVRRILDHCGLPFEESCLRFHETRRAVRTASSEQVRQPLYSSALGYWRNYERHLQVWRDELGDIVEGLPAVVRDAGL
jgi:tetratricopeptide (TPR) repeat protein